LKRTLLVTFLIVALCTFCSQTWAGHSWEGDEKLWKQYEAGEIQLAITVGEDQMAIEDIPMDWTRKMIVDWLKTGWLVIEETTVGDVQGGDCHLIVRYDSRWCVEGPGPRRCCCPFDVQY